MTKAGELVQAWRDIGPVAWAESDFGWIGDEGRPIQLEAWQRVILATWFLNRETCTALAISNVKKTGKTFVNAVLTAWRWLALPGVHFCAANDLDQSQARQFAMIIEMVKRHPYLSQVVKVTKNELTFEPTGSTLTALSVDAAGNAGANHLTASHTEAWGIIYEGSTRAFEELTTPPGRFHGLPALRILDSYAGFEGESRVWHGLVDRGLQGQRINREWPIFQAGGLILFHIEGEEARRRCFRGTAEEAKAYYDDQAANLRPNAFIRMHGNQRTAGESAFIDPEAWEACYSGDVHPIGPGDRVRLVVGCDASTSRDLTSLVGVAYDPTTGLTDVRLVRVWKPQKILGIRAGKPTVDLVETIGAEVTRLHQAGQLAGVVCDPYQLHTLIVEWERAGIRVIELPQNAGRVDSDQALYDAIIGRSVRHYNDPGLNDAILNAVALETARGFRLAKEKASKKIDPAVALSMAHYGARLVLGGDASYSGVGWFPNPWEGAELETYKEWELLSGQPTGQPTGVNFKPHPPGVTWRTCRHRMTGCVACQSELESEGYYQKIKDANEPGSFWDDGQADRQARELSRLNMDQQAESRVDHRAVDVFWKTVKGRVQK